MTVAAPSYDIAVIGTGPAGLAAALALSKLGARIAIIGPNPTQPDNRTAALFAGSVTLLENLGLADFCLNEGEPIRGIRIIDDMGSFLRAPEVTFTAGEVGLERFGFNLPNGALTAAMRALVSGDPKLELIDATVSAVRPGPEGVEIEIGNQTLKALLVVGADGRQSLCRSAAGITTKTWQYDQSAITCTFEHQRGHQGISTEFHRPAGPFTLVPSPGRASSLVWVEKPREAARLLALDDDDFRGALEQRLHGVVGPVGSIGPRGMFPLAGMSTNVAGRERIALVGEAVHVFPPIGAQGLNLGLRDVAVLVDCVEDALTAGGDIGATTVLEAYDRGRRTDIFSRIWSVDLLNRSLLTQSAPVQALRGMGLHALKSIGPLRRMAIREGLMPSFVDPRLMQRPGHLSAPAA